MNVKMTNPTMNYQKCEVHNCDRILNGRAYKRHLIDKHGYKFTNDSPKMPVQVEATR